MGVVEVRRGEEGEVQRQEDGVRVVSGQWSAEEDEEDVEGWGGEYRGEDEGEEGGLD